MRVTALIELGDAAPPAAVGRTAYRIAQEGLTNARKHAPGAAVTLTVRAPDGDLQVEIRSLAPVAVAAAAPLPGARTGLIGLSERVSLAGGTLEHGVDPDGAFVLRALQAGAAGFLLKDTPPAEIVRAIELVHAGDGMLSPTVTRQLISLVAGDSDAGARAEQARDRMATLSPRERDVALAIGRGET